MAPRTKAAKPAPIPVPDPVPARGKRKATASKSEVLVDVPVEVPAKAPAKGRGTKKTVATVIPDTIIVPSPKVTRGRKKAPPQTTAVEEPAKEVVIVKTKKSPAKAKRSSSIRGKAKSPLKSPAKKSPAKKVAVKRAATTPKSTRGRKSAAVTVAEQPDTVAEESKIVDDQSPPRKAARRGRALTNSTTTDQLPTTASEQANVKEPTKELKKTIPSKRGRKSQVVSNDSVEEPAPVTPSEDLPVEPIDLSQKLAEPQPAKKRGRVARASKVDVPVEEKAPAPARGKSRGRTAKAPAKDIPAEIDIAPVHADTAPLEEMQGDDDEEERPLEIAEPAPKQASSAGTKRKAPAPRLTARAAKAATASAAASDSQTVQPKPRGRPKRKLEELTNSATIDVPQTEPADKVESEPERVIPTSLETCNTDSDLPSQNVIEEKVMSHELDNHRDDEQEETKTDLIPQQTSSESQHIEATDTKATFISEESETTSTVETSRDEDLITTKKIRAHLLTTPSSAPLTVSAGARVLAWGDPLGGALGLGPDVSLRRRPQLIESFPDLDNDPIASVAAGAMHTLVLTTSGKVYSFGCNDEGALGRITAEDEDETEPERVSLSFNDENTVVVRISAGDSHGAALTSDGKVLIWGNFRSDQGGPQGLTPENHNKIISPIEVVFPSDLNESNNGNIIAVDIASGSDHLLILDVLGRVYSLGIGEQGQLGRLSEDDANAKEDSNRIKYLSPARVHFGDSSSPCDAIWAGHFSSFARIAVTGEIYGWGLNRDGQLALPLEQMIVWKPILISHLSAGLGLEENVKLVQLSGATEHTLALDSTGRVLSFGSSRYGRLGYEIVKPTNGIVSNGNGVDHSEEKSAHVNGESELDATSHIQLVPKEVDGLSGPVSVVCAKSSQSFAVTRSGELFAWGMGSVHLGFSNPDEEQTQDVLSPRQVVGKQLLERKVLSVAAGAQHAVALVVAKAVDVSSIQQVD